MNIETNVYSIHFHTSGVTLGTVVILTRLVLVAFITIIAKKYRLHYQNTIFYLNLWSDWAQIKTNIIYFCIEKKKKKKKKNKKKTNKQKKKKKNKQTKKQKNKQKNKKKNKNKNKKIYI